MTSLQNKKNKALKMMLWFGIGSLFMTFAGLTSALIVSKNRADWMKDFVLPIEFNYSLLVIIASSIFLFLAKKYLKKLSFERKEYFRFVHISTDEVFGSIYDDDKKFNESSPYDPRSPYSASKAASDHFVKSFFHYRSFYLLKKY